MSKVASIRNAGQAANDTRARRARVEAAPSSRSIIGRAIGRSYERFLEFPVLVVLGVMWVAGVAVLGSMVLVAYAVISTLVWGW